MRKKTKSIYLLLACFVLLWTLWRSRFQGPSPKHGYDPFDYGWVRPNFYKKGDEVELVVNKVESAHRQFPYSYYDLPFVCPPSGSKKPLHLSLNEIVRGDRKWQSDYHLKFGVEVECERLCDRKTQPEALREADRLIRQGYVAHWLVDRDMPAATTFVKSRNGKKFYSAGFPIGTFDSSTDKTYLHNHVMLVVRYHTLDINKHTIVGFEVYPKSTSDHQCPGGSKGYKHFEIKTQEEEVSFIPFTYSVYWREEFHNDWSHRWNFFMTEDQRNPSNLSQSFHWMCLANSIVVVAFMSFVVALIFAKIRGDETASSLASLWIFQSTHFLSLLNLTTAMGVQFLFATLGSLIVSCSLNKFHDITNWVVSTAVICFILGAFASSILGSLLSPGQRVSLGISVLCGCALPGFTLAVVLILNCIVWAKDSTNALPFGTVVLIVAVYFVICGPLSLLGGLSARRMKTTYKLSLEDVFPFSFLLTTTYDGGNGETELAPDPLPRVLSNPFLLTLASGLPPFMVICVELLFVYKSLWLEKTGFYSLYGFLLVNIILLCIIVTEVSLVVCYVMMLYSSSVSSGQKKAQEYESLKLEGGYYIPIKRLGTYLKMLARVFSANLNMAFANWRWKSFVAGGSIAWYLELYSLYHLVFVLHLRDFSSILLFVCYTSLFNFMCWCAFGALGYLSCLWFLNRISSADKAQ